MPAQVMKVVSASKHPNADALRVYELESLENKRQVIANIENVYEVGDLVNVVVPGSVLKDGTRIKPATLRGLPSLGMALGPAAPGANVGDDVTDEFCLPAEPESVSVVKWPDIESLFNVRRYCELTELAPKLRYKAKVKLDGTNGGVQISPSGQVVAQSRSTIVTPGDDNYGFAAWVQSNHSYFEGLKKSVRVVLFGEWCGQGIQKRTAISQIDRKVFVVFAIQLGNDEHEIFECEPDTIRALLPEHKDIFVLPWHKDELQLDYKDKDQLQAQADVINELVAEVERCDPWVKDTFNIEGLGEGVVLYPRPGGEVVFGRNMYSDFMFKAKGEKHKVVNTKKPVQIDPEFVETIDGFVKLFVTDARLEQGVTVACNNTYDMKHMGDYVKWFTNDVKKESEAELAKSGLEWRQVSKAITSAASKWYKHRCETQ